MTTQEKTQVFYQPADASRPRHRVIDLVVLKDGQQVGYHSLESQATLALRYPGVLIGDMDAITKEIYDSMILPPEVIDEADFINMLEVLPPLGYTVFGKCSSFKLSEFYSGPITYIYAHVDGSFYRLRNFHTLSHQDIVSLVRASTVQAAGAKA